MAIVGKTPGMSTRQQRQAPLVSLGALKSEASAQKLLNRLVEQGLEAQRASLPPTGAEPSTQPDPKRSQAAVVELLQVFTRCMVRLKLLARRSLVSCKI